MDIKPIVAKLKLDSTGFVKGLSDSEKAVFAMSAASAALAASVVAVAQATANFNDAQIKAARVAGVSVEKFSALAVAAQYSGATQEQVVKALGKLAALTPDAAKKLDAFGVAMRDTNGKIKDNEALLSAISDRMQQLEKPSDKTALAIAAFGEEGAKLVNVLKDGSAGLEAFQKEAERAGLVVTERAGVAAEIYNDNLTRLSMSTKGLVNSLAEVYIEFANETGIVNELSEAIQGVTAWVRDMDDGTKRTIVSLAAAAVTTATLAGSVLAISKSISVATSSIETFQSALKLVGIQAKSTMAAMGPLLALQAIVVTITFLEVWKKQKAQETFDRDVEAKKEAFKKLSEEGRKSFEGLTFGINAYIKQFDDASKANDQSLKNFARQGLEGFREQIKKATGDARAFNDVLHGPVSIENFRELMKAYSDALAEMREEESKKPPVIVNLELKRNKIDLPDFSSLANKDLPALSDAFSTTQQSYQRFEEQISQARGLKALNDKFSVEMKKLDSQLASGQINQAEYADATEKLQTELGKSTEKLALTTSEKIQVYGAAVIGYAQQIVSALGTIATASTKMVTDRLKYQSELTDFFSKLALNAISKQKDAELEAIDKAEQAKIDALRGYSNERLALLDEEYARLKEAEDAKFALFVESERQRFEADKEAAFERTEDKNNRLALDAAFEEDWLKYLEQLQSEHEETLTGLAQEAGQKKVDEEASANAQIEKVKEESAAKKAAVEQQYADKEKQISKQTAAVKYALDLASFNANKQLMTSQAIGAAAMGIAMTAVGVATSFAQGGPIGAVIGLVLAGVIGTLVVAGLASSLAAIQAMKPPLPPAELFMESGGYVVGKRHSQGGVSANIEGGEAVISRPMTEKLYSGIDKLDSGGYGGSPVIFEAGAIQNNIAGVLDEKLVDEISDRTVSRVTDKLRSA